MTLVIFARLAARCSSGPTTRVSSFFAPQRKEGAREDVTLYPEWRVVIESHLQEAED